MCICVFSRSSSLSIFTDHWCSFFINKFTSSFLITNIVLIFFCRCWMIIFIHFIFINWFYWNGFRFNYRFRLWFIYFRNNWSLNRSYFLGLSFRLNSLWRRRFLLWFRPCWRKRRLLILSLKLLTWSLIFLSWLHHWSGLLRSLRLYHLLIFFFFLRSCF